MSCAELFKGASSTFAGYFLIVSVSFILYGLTATLYLLKTNTIETLDKEFIAVPSVSLIFCGCILFLVIILGCCAICQEVPCCLEGYSVFLVCLATVQLGLGVYSLLRFSVENEELQIRIYDDVSRMFDNYDKEPQQMDTTQQWMKCCGYSDFGPSDWLRNGTIPASCCEGKLQHCATTSEKIFQDGCSLKLYSFIVGTNFIIGLSFIVTAITEVIGAVMGISLSCAFWRNSRIMWI